MNEAELRKMRILINRLPAARFRVDKAMSRATKMTAVLTGMPHGSGVGNPVERGYEWLEVARETLKQIEDELGEMRKRLIPLIEALENPVHKSIMRLRYIDGWSVREIAYRRNYSERHIQRILRIAEKDVTYVTPK